MIEKLHINLNHEMAGSLKNVSSFQGFFYNQNFSFEICGNYSQTLKNDCRKQETKMGRIYGIGSIFNERNVAYKGNIFQNG